MGIYMIYLRQPRTLLAVVEEPHDQTITVGHIIRKWCVQNKLPKPMELELTFDYAAVTPWAELETVPCRD